MSRGPERILHHPLFRTRLTRVVPRKPLAQRQGTRRLSVEVLRLQIANRGKAKRGSPSGERTKSEVRFRFFSTKQHKRIRLRAGGDVLFSRPALSRPTLARWFAVAWPAETANVTGTCYPAARGTMSAVDTRMARGDQCANRMSDLQMFFPFLFALVCSGLLEQLASRNAT